MLWPTSSVNIICLSSRKIFWSQYYVNWFLLLFLILSSAILMYKFHMIGKLLGVWWKTSLSKGQGSHGWKGNYNSYLQIPLCCLHRYPTSILTFQYGNKSSTYLVPLSLYNQNFQKSLVKRANYNWFDEL